MAMISKTRSGSEYRVRGSKGKLYGEFNKASDAVQRAIKVANRRGSMKKKTMKKY